MNNLDTELRRNSFNPESFRCRTEKKHILFNPESFRYRNEKKLVLFHPGQITLSFLIIVKGNFHNWHTALKI